MKSDLFKSIVSDYRQLKSHHGINQMKLIVDKLLDKHSNIGYMLMFSLVNYEYRKDAKNAFSHNSSVNWNAIFEEWYKGSQVLQLAEKYNVCAYTLLRNLVIKMTNNNKNTAKKYLKDPSFCENGKLAYEIMTINLHDIMNGLFYNQLSLNSGIAFEIEIRSILEHNKISFMSEEELRSNNYDVTPDFRLNFPLVLIRTNSSMVLCQCNSDNIPVSIDNEIERSIITWIECKSLFASVECHIEYYESQFYSYINRFGDGLVLYKYGYVEDIPHKYCQNLIISQQMPIFLKHGS